MGAYRPGNILALQARVIGALVLREMHTRFGEFRAGYLWAVVEPMVHLLSFSFLIAFFAHSAPLGSSLEVFVATGVIGFFFFRDMATNVEAAHRANRALLYFPIVKAFDTVMARIVLEAATWIVISAATLGMLGLLGFESMPNDFLRCIGVMVVIGWFGAGFGVLNAAISHFTQVWDKIVHVLMRPLYLFSGVAFLPSRMPEEIKYYISFLPTAHAVDWLREAFFVDYHSSFVNKPMIIVLGLIFWASGLFLERLMRSRMEVE